MSDSMIERVASALRDHARKNGIVRTWDEYAEIAIGAMRDLPDQLGNHLPTGYRPGSHSARDIWESIIDTALSERREKGNG